jgi:hypothetical protein
MVVLRQDRWDKLKGWKLLWLEKTRKIFDANSLDFHLWRNDRQKWVAFGHFSGPAHCWDEQNLEREKESFPKWFYAQPMSVLGPAQWNGL